MQHELDAQLAALPEAIREQIERIVLDGSQWREHVAPNSMLEVEWCPPPGGSVVVFERKRFNDETGHAPSSVAAVGTTSMLLNFATAYSFRRFLIRYMRFQLLFTHYRPGEQSAAIEAPKQPTVDEPLPRNTVDAD